MTPQFCSRETDLWNAIVGGGWPDAADPDLRAHVAQCALCREVELVAGSLRLEAAAVRNEVTPPSSAIVWWRAQMRARQEAARIADRPITIVHALALACVSGLALGLIGTMTAWFRGSTNWPSGWNLSAENLTAIVGAIDFSSRWVLVPGLIVILSLVIMPIAFYAIVSED